MKNPWALAGTGWQAEARNAVGQQVGRLNTPNVENTEKLLDLAIGLPDALHDVSWPKMGEAKALANVDEFAQDIRGEIVHRGTTPWTAPQRWRQELDQLLRRPSLSSR